MVEILRLVRSQNQREEFTMTNRIADSMTEEVDLTMSCSFDCATIVTSTVSNSFRRSAVVCSRGSNFEGHLSQRSSYGAEWRARYKCSYQVEGRSNSNLLLPPPSVRNTFGSNRQELW
mmetsp:Transcript_32919/g.74513  ORF Transcript_32919/g.74513 Transcript_32919/m.74513 type:complete len:118 (-) Transcript_32919:493-846(-)